MRYAPAGAPAGTVLGGTQRFALNAPDGARYALTSLMCAWRCSTCAVALDVRLAVREGEASRRESRSCVKRE